MIFSHKRNYASWYGGWNKVIVAASRYLHLLDSRKKTQALCRTSA